MSNLSGITSALGRKPATPAAAGKSGAGKSNWSRNPDNATWMFYVDKKQKQQALRKWEDEHPETPEASDLLAFLLGRFLAG